MTATTICKWDEIFESLKHNLERIERFAEIIKEEKDFEVSDVIQEYIMSRFELIEHCLCGLYLGDLFTKEEWVEFNKIQQTIIEFLEDGDEQHWKNDKIFKAYLSRIQEFELYKKYCM